MTLTSQLKDGGSPTGFLYRGDDGACVCVCECVLVFLEGHQ